MKMLARAALLLSALFACAPAVAQHATVSSAPAGYAPEMAPVTLPATSTPVSNQPTVGTTTLGPFTPQLGRDIQVLIRSPNGAWSGTITVGTSVDNCATVNPLTVGGQAWGVYTSNANEPVWTPTLGGVVFCATEVIASGKPSVELRQ